MSDGLKLFISHSSQDRETARAIINLVRAALNLKPDEIRCTSVDGYRLPIGADTDERLREEVLAADAFVGIISPESIGSAYVLFELGGRWGAKKPLFPLLAPDVSSDILKGPLAGLNALSCSSEPQLHQLVEDISRGIGRRLNSPAAYLSEIKAVMSSRIKEKNGGENSKEVRSHNSGQEQPDNKSGHLSIVKIMASQVFTTIPELVVALSWSRVKVQHFFDYLIDNDYVQSAHFNKDGSPAFQLTRKGRALAVENDLA